MADRIRAENPIALLQKSSGPVDLLLFDHNTDENIIWATDDPSIRQNPIDPSELYKIEPRFMKSKERRARRTKERAEVFTPPDVCKLQNDLILKHWIDLPLEQFIDAKFLEITCGEAPYLVSRYNVVDGTPIELDDRVGLLDRKLQSINRHVDDQSRWFDLARRAFQSIYGYEFQGDNLLIARCNLFLTAEEFYQSKFRAELPHDFSNELVDIITWNLFQYDGLNNCRPFDEYDGVFKGSCKVMDWKAGASDEF